MRWAEGGVLFLFASVAFAAPMPLQGRNILGEAVPSDSPDAVFEYDPNSNLTWLRDWNYAATSGYDADGRMNWYQATAWAAGLTVGTFGGWRLPPTVWPDASCVPRISDPHLNDFIDFSGCTGSPMSYLWKEVLGNTPYVTFDTGVFQNLQAHPYWSGSPWDDVFSWSFVPRTGHQGYTSAYDKGSFFAVAVREGDVVPEPDVMVLSLLSVGASVTAGRRRRRA